MGQKKKKQLYSDRDLILILQKFSKKAKGPLTTNRFLELGGEPTIAVFIARFGSWAEACKRAKVKTGRGRPNYERKHSAEDLLNYVANYLKSDGATGTAVDYDAWQKNVKDAPSLALIRQRLGKWNEIKELAKRGKN